ncbi:type II toxin-antitoxin system RelE/ParE family toxin [Vallitalea maricola]|uniref:type II toxin-antitoxin system RelE/ParE family toxin n=1 Tax=Vallitalea maricola TaxID=3074433 RepID=UPI0030DC3371
MSKPYKIIYYPTAMDDVRNILNYISIDNPPAAYQLIDKIDHAVQSLADFPSKGTIPKDLQLKTKQYRMLIIESYILFYIPNHTLSEIEIMRFYQASRIIKVFFDTH